MRKRRSHAGSDVIIDLTSLLDVMFIILLVVLCGQNMVKEDLSESREGAEAARAQAEAEYRLYEEQRDLADSLNQYVWAVSIVVPYDEDEVTRRQIRFLKEGQAIETIDLVGNDVTAAVEDFRESLAGYIQEHKDRPVILSLNEEDDYILYRDEVMVQEVFRELAAAYQNVYIKGNISEETE